MSKEEYEEKIEDLKEKLAIMEDNFNEAECRVEDLIHENQMLDRENDELREQQVDKESFAEKAFDRGVEAGIDFGQDKTKVLKAWLNYKIEERL